MGPNASGTSPDQLSPNSLLGGAAFIEVSDLYAMLVAHTTLDLLRGSKNTTARVVYITDSAVQGVFIRDDADTTTPDDGKDCLLTADDTPVRFKRRLALRTYTPTSGSDTTMITGAVVYDANGIWIKTGASTVMLAQFMRSGATNARPTGLTAAHTGLQYYDTSLNKPVWYSGSGTTWKDATGATV
ncbi:hypothetical protein [Arsenicibacter rosenii]|uniref:Uncharacterized protein n=1 Tax=Arsenicibacter rosenii TaxID=1750698 RepID=A0A1S2VIE8_9BACT|nr:hypothetical protein [Arsenicibacter rosenii]OIN57628.1 hypothetical protein BLX24_19320 [Arsenicibacter rosenii]